MVIKSPKIKLPCKFIKNNLEFLISLRVRNHPHSILQSNFRGSDRHKHLCNYHRMNCLCNHPGLVQSPPVQIYAPFLSLPYLSVICYLIKLMLAVSPTNSPTITTAIFCTRTITCSQATIHLLCKTFQFKYMFHSSHSLIHLFCLYFSPK